MLTRMMALTVGKMYKYWYIQSVWLALDLQNNINIVSSKIHKFDKVSA